MVEAGLPGLYLAHNEAEYQRLLDRMLHFAKEGKHPN
jgi:hypothetical protein